MKRLIVPIIFLSFLSTVIHGHDILKNDIIFNNHPHGHIYWKALMLIAKNKKDEAVRIIQALKSNELNALSILEKNCSINSIEDCFDELFIRTVARDPHLLSQLRLFESIGIRDHNAYLNDVSPQGFMIDLEYAKSNLALLKQYAIEHLNTEQKVTYQIFEWMLNHQVTGEKFLFHQYRVNQMFGIILDLNFVLTEFHTLEVKEDIDNYIARLNKIPAYLKQTTDFLDHQHACGVCVPAFALEKVIATIEHSLPTNSTEHIFYRHLAQHINTLDGIEKDTILQNARELLETQIYPAYHAFKDHCKTLHGKAHYNGVWVLPDGDAYYAYCLQLHTTTDLTAEEIHELGLQEVARISNEIRNIFAYEGIVDPDKTVGELLQDLSKRPEFYYPDTEQGRQQCLADYEAILTRARKELYPLFDLKPSSPVAIKPVPKHEQDGMPGAYYSGPSLDGKRPGRFFANLRNMQEVPTYHMETLAIHEAEPGHHFQIALQNDMNIPILRKANPYFTAYIEGWALYAERLAYEHNFYSSSWSKIGHLHDELFRAARLVVDTGIHHKRWSREQAIEYMYNIMGSHKGMLTTEVERYFVYPGQACAYKIGQLKILELREHAKQALGEQFDIREFHNVVLSLGAAPLDVLEMVVNNYIQGKHAQVCVQATV